MKKWWIGCSGFSYKHWRELFYPQGLPQRKWFEFYCESFNTVELNVTFYRVPKIEILKGWYTRSPADFKFTVKAPRVITHFKKFNNVKHDINNFYSIASDGLENKLGCILFQLHPKIVFSEDTLNRIVDALDISYTNVLEFRHPSWWNKDVIAVLRKSKIAFCNISYPALPDSIFKTAASLYYRFHGVPELYKSPYSIVELQNVSSELNAHAGTKNVYAYFNNDIGGSAFMNARQFQEIVTTL